MRPFAGFSDKDVQPSCLPDEFFAVLLQEIQDMDELKVTLYILLFLSRKEKNNQWITWKELSEDETFLGGLAADAQTGMGLLRGGLKKALDRQTILAGNCGEEYTPDSFFVLNSSWGKAVLKRLSGQPLPGDSGPAFPVGLERDRPNIFSLYEQNIGPLTPIIAEVLQQAEKEYPREWIDEAVNLAVKNNIRRWTYVEAILKRWNQEGRNEKERRDRPQDQRKYLDGEYSDIVKH